MNRLKIKCWTVLILILVSQWLHAEIHVNQGYVPEAPPAAEVMAAYVDITNVTERDLTIISVTSAQFDRVEIHSSSVANGIVSMQRLPGIEIKPKHTVSLEPGGMHLMLFNPHTQLKTGDTVELTLHLASGSHEHIELPVQQRRFPDHHHHH